MIDPQALIDAFNRGFHPLPGRCLIEMDKVPSKSDLLHIPETAQELRLLKEVKSGSVWGDISFTGIVRAVTPRRNPKTGELLTEDFYPGDRVVVMLLVEDFNQKMIVTLNTRIYAVVED